MGKTTNFGLNRFGQEGRISDEGYKFSLKDRDIIDTLLFSLFMLDVFPLPIPKRLMNWAATREGGSYGAVFVLGVTSGIVAAPCGAPAFAVVLTWVAASQAGAMGFVYLFAFSLGMTAILVVVGLFSGTLASLPQSGKWMVWIKKAAGILMIAVAQYYFIKAGYNL